MARATEIRFDTRGNLWKLSAARRVNRGKVSVGLPMLIDPEPGAARDAAVIAYVLAVCPAKVQEAPYVHPGSKPLAGGL